MAKVGTSNPDRTISLKRLQCVVENKHKHNCKLPEDGVLIPKHVAVILIYKFAPPICPYVGIYLYVLVHIYINIYSYIYIYL